MIVLKPFQYETIFTKKRMKIGIALLWVIAFIIGVCTYTVYELNETEQTISGRLNRSISLNRTATSPEHSHCYNGCTNGFMLLHYHISNEF